ncbi:MAG: lamin tail domain-containing protein [Bacillota bacterium]|nr:lamin tail domain-containing protein [Bacillota bacterium]
MKKSMKSIVSLLVVLSMLTGLAPFASAHVPIPAYSEKPTGYSTLNDKANYLLGSDEAQEWDTPEPKVTEPSVTPYTLPTPNPYPDILITEAIVNSKNLDGGSDPYDAVEIYNASGKDLDLKNYELGYKIDSAADLTSEYVNPTYTGINNITYYSALGGDTGTEPSTLNFPKDSSMILWIKQPGNATDKVLTKAQFAAAYGVDANNVLLAEQPTASNVAPSSTATSSFYLKNHANNRITISVLKKTAVPDLTKYVTDDNDIVSLARYNSATWNTGLEGSSFLLKWDNTNKMMMPIAECSGANSITPELGKQRWNQKPVNTNDVTLPQVTNNTPATGDVSSVNISANVSDMASATTPGDIVKTTLYYRDRSAVDPSYKAITKDYVLNSGTVLTDVPSVTINETLNSAEIYGAKYLDYYIEATDDGGNVATLGTAGAPNTIDLSGSYATVDTTPPAITISSPANGASFDTQFNGNIVAGYTDDTGINKSTVTISIDGGTAIPISDATDSGFTYSLATSPITALGKHTITVNAQDTSIAKNQGTQTVEFYVNAAETIALDKSTPYYVQTGNNIPVAVNVISDTTSGDKVKLYYKKTKDTTYSVADMAAGTSTDLSGSLKQTAYSYSIPATFYGNSRKLDYYIEVSNGGSVGLRYPSADAASISMGDQPEIVITEALQDCAGSDYYEAIELYNNTDTTLDLKDYAIGYKNDAKPAGEAALVNPTYTSPSSTYVNFITKYYQYGVPGDESTVTSLPFPPKSTMTLWCKELVNTNTQTLNDLKTNLPKVNLDQTLICGQGSTMTNGTPSGFYMVNHGGARVNLYVIKLSKRTNNPADVVDPAPASADKQTVVRPDQKVVSTARYYFSSTEFTPGNSVKLAWDNANQIMKSYPTMQGVDSTLNDIGSLDSFQKPLYTDDSTPPVISTTPISETTPGSITLSAGITDSDDIRTGRIFYRLAGSSVWTKVEHNYVAEDSRDKTQLQLSETIPASKVLGKAYIEYYFEAADGNNNTATSGSASQPYKTVFSDHNAPVVNITSPDNGYSIAGAFAGTIAATVSDEMSIDKWSGKVVVDNGTPISIPITDVSDTSVSYSFAANPLTIGTHTIKLMVTDTSATPNTGSATITVNVTEPTSAQIIHTPVDYVNYNSPLVIAATVVGGSAPTLNYQKKNTTNTVSIPMVMQGSSKSLSGGLTMATYTASIPYSDLSSLGMITYSISAGTMNTPTYEAKVQKGTDIIFTEASANSANVGSDDGFDYVEVYNNSNKTIDLFDYKLAYEELYSSNAGKVYFNNISKYTTADNGQEPSELNLAPGQYLGIWIKSNTPTALSNLTSANFKANYGKPGAEIAVAEHMQFGTTSPTLGDTGTTFFLNNIANGVTANVYLVSKNATTSNFKDSVTATMTYTGDQLNADCSIGHMYYDSSKQASTAVKVTSGENTNSISEASPYWPYLPVDYSDVTPPTIANHTNVPTAEVGPVTLSANMNDDVSLRYGELYYRNSNATDFKTLITDFVTTNGTTPVKSNTFSATIPQSEVNTMGTIEYYFEAVDAGGNKVDSQKYTTKINHNDQPVTTSDVVISEMCPNPAGGDPWEYVEIVNTTDHDIPLSNLEMRIYPNIASTAYNVNPLVWDDDSSKILKPNEPFIYFIYNSASFTEGGVKYSTQQQRDDAWESFYSANGMPVASKDDRVIAPANSDVDGSGITGATGLQNSSAYRRGAAIYDKTAKKEIAKAGYNYADNLTAADSVTQQVNGTAIEYLFFPGYDPIDHINSVMFDYAANPSPGALDADQTKKGDGVAPQIVYDKSSDYREPDQTEFRIQVKDADTAYVVLFYKLNYQQFYRPVFLTKEGSTDYYTGEIPVSELQVAKQISYYFVATDGTDSTVFPEECAYNPFVQSITDVSGPRILSQYPEQGTQVERAFNGQIVINYKDFSGVDLTKTKLVFDGKDVTKDALITDNKIYYTPGQLNEFKRYNYSLTLADKFGGEIPAGSGLYPKQNVAVHDMYFDVVPVNSELSKGGQIIHAPMQQAVDSQDLTITAEVTDSNSSQNMQVVYGFNDNVPSKTITMTKGTSEKTTNADGNDVYTTFYNGVIPKGELKNNTKVNYFITSGTLKAPTTDGKYYSTKITPASPVPDLIVTEVMANPQGADNAEYMEVANISNGPINLKDYRMEYIGSIKTKPNEIKKSDITQDCILYPNDVAILWFVTVDSETAQMNVQDFKDRWGIGNSNVPVLEIPANSARYPNCFNLGNTGIKYIRILKDNDDSGKYVCSLVYNDEVDKGYNNGTSEMVVTYGPPTDGTVNLTKLDQSVKPSPGTIDYRQKKVNYDDVQSPLIIYQNTNDKPIDTGDYHIKVKIIDESELRYSAVKFKTYTTGKYLAADSNGYIEAQLTPVYNEPNYYEFTVPNEYIQYSNDLQFYFEASDGLHKVSLNDVTGEPFKVNFNDKVGPQLLTYKPEPYYFYEDSKTPSFKLTFEDNSGINKNSIKLYVAPEASVKKDGKVDSSMLCQSQYDVTSNSAITNDGRVYTLNYTPGNAYADGTYVAEFVAYDNNGNRNLPFVQSAKDHFTYFEIGDDSVLNHYHGEVHSHTAESDGEGTVVEAYTYARDKGHADYFSVTDHNHYLNSYTYANEINDEKQFYNPGPGGFINFNGWEMTWNNATGWQGHSNAINADWVEANVQITLEDYYKELCADPNVVGQFNHPTYGWGTFDDFGYYSEAYDKKMQLIEINYTASETEYYRALTKGWHLAPTSNEDNHQKRWTTLTPRTGVTLAPALTRDNLLEAWSKGRAYESGDGNIRINYKINNEWMGSRLKDPEKLDFDIGIFNADGSAVPGGELSVVSEDSTIVYQRTFTSADVVNGQINVKFTLPPEYKYYLVKFVKNGASRSLTAPIWVERSNNIQITDYAQGESDDVNKPISVIPTIKNTSNGTLTDVKVDFFRGSDKTGVTDSELVLSKDLAAYEAEMAKPEASRDPAVLAATNTAVPVETRTYASLAPNQTITAAANLATDINNQRIYVRVSGKLNGKEYYDLGYTAITPIMISEITAVNNTVHNKKGVAVDNAVRYIELYNMTNQAMDLNGDSINMWESMNTTPANKTANQYEVYKFAADSEHPNQTLIAPHGTKLVWYRADSSFTLSDFNKFYGTNLTEDDVIPIDGYVLADSGAKQIEFKINDVSTLTTKYNWNTILSDFTENNSIIYKYPTIGIPEATKLSVKAAPTPGSVVPEQIPTPQTDYSLKSLSLMTGNNTVNVALSDKSTSYRVSVPEGTKSATVVPVLNCPSLKLRVNGVEQYSAQGLTTLTLGNTGATAVIEVLDGAGNSKATYTVTVGSGDLNIGSDNNGASGGAGGSSGSDSGTGGSGSGSDTGSGSSTDKLTNQVSDTVKVDKAVSVNYTADSSQNIDYLVAGVINADGSVTYLPSSSYKDGKVSWHGEVSGNVAVFYRDISFYDTTGKWYENAAKYMAARSIVNGVGDGKFAPNNNISRADITLMLMRAFAGDKTGTGTFDDVDASAYYASAVATAKDLGIATGAYGNFNPQANVTRQDMFVLLARTLKAFGLLDEEADTSKVYFNDISSIASYAKDDILLLAANGYINGSDGKINPNGTATRAETAQMLSNYFQN